MSNALDGEMSDGRHHQAVRVYYEDTDFSGGIIIQGLSAEERPCL